MTETRLLVRLDRHTGAIERMIGLLRRRRFAVRRAAISFTDDDAVELMIRVDGDADIPRLRAELEGLEDVRSIEELDHESTRFTREMVLAWIRPDAAVQATGAARIVAVTDGGCLMELTGSSEEIESTLARLRESGVISNVTRSEVAAPLPAPFLDQRSDG